MQGLDYQEVGVIGAILEAADHSGVLLLLHAATVSTQQQEHNLKDRLDCVTSLLRTLQ